MGEVHTICRCCAAGCGITVKISDADEQVLEVRGDPAHTLSRGYLCPKGSGLPWHHHRPDRLNHAVLRGQATTWEACAADLAASMRAVVDKHGAAAVGGYAGTGGALDFVAGAVFYGLLRGIGTPQVYSPTTIDMAPSYRAAEIVTGSVAELIPRWVPEDPDSRLVIFIGCNPFVSHGYFTILTNPARRIRAFQQRGGKVWVFDPRRTETARRATGHVVLRPDTDSFVLGWLLRETLDQPPDPALLARTVAPEDIEALRDILRPLTRQAVAERCDVDEDVLQRLLDDVRRAGRISIVTGTGVNFAGYALTTELMRWAVLAATGSLDQPGGMSFDTGFLAKLDEREEWTPAPVEGNLAGGAPSRPDLHGITNEMPCAAMVDEIEAGNLKAVMIGGGSPLTAFPEPDRMLAALKSLDVLVVADVVDAPLTKIATHVLPSLGQLERSDLNFFNSNICLAPAVVKPGPGRWPAWRAYALIGEALGLDIFFGLDPRTATEVDVLKAVTSTARYDYDALVAAGTSGLKAPAMTDWVARAALPEGRWRIASPTLMSRLKALIDAFRRDQGDLMLVSRRQTQHTSSTQHIRSERRYDRPTLLISPDDAAALGIEDGSDVEVTSAAGSVQAAAEISTDIRHGVVSLPHGWIAANVARLVSGRKGAIDPMTGQPQMSGIPVAVRAMSSWPANAPRKSA